MARNYSSISEVKTLAANVPETGAGSTQVIFNEGTTGLPAVPFVLVLNPDTSNEEVVLAIGLSGSTYTITRNIEGGGVKSHTVNQEVRHMIVGSDLQLVHNHLDNTTTAHGVSGAVVGTTSEQTLTLKRLTTPKINENVNLTATSTELNRVVGVTSSIQTQIDTKAPSAGPTFTGTVVLPSTTSIGTVSATEISHLDGVTSAVQTQLDTKAPIASPTFTGIVTLPTSGNGLSPVGSITMWAGNAATPPTGWLVCNGQSTTGYTALANIVGATVPDMQGLVPVGFKASDDAFGTLKGTGGSKTSTAAHTHNLASHSHTINHDHGAFTSGDDSPDHSHTAVFYDTATNQGDSAGGQFDTGSDQPTAERYIPTTGASVRHQHNIDVPNFTGSSGGPSDNTSGPSSVAATNGNLQPYFTLNFIIKH